MAAMDLLEAQLRMIDRRGLFTAGCVRIGSVWHGWVRVDGELTDKGPCEHDHSYDDRPGCWCCGEEKCSE